MKRRFIGKLVVADKDYIENLVKILIDGGYDVEVQKKEIIINEVDRS